MPKSPSRSKPLKSGSQPKVRSAAKKPTTRPRKPSVIHRITSHPGRLALIERVGSSNKLTASVFGGGDAAAMVAEAHPPKVVPIRNDPAHVLRCDWSVADNEYTCEIIAADDPRATV